MQDMQETITLLLRGLDASRDALAGLGASDEVLERLDTVIATGMEAQNIYTLA